MKPLQLEFTWRDLGQRYIAQLEGDLKLERERGAELRKDVEFYRGKVERLELAMAQVGTPVQQAYAMRTDMPARPQIEQIPIPRKKNFNDLKREWNSLTQQQQEQIVEKGEWNTEEANNAGNDQQ